MSQSLNCAQCMVNGGLAAINRASHLCDPGTTMSSGHMCAEMQSISVGLRGFFSGFFGFLPLIKIDSQSITSGCGRISSIGITTGILAFY